MATHHDALRSDSAATAQAQPASTVQIAADVFLQSLAAAGVEYMFVNLGTDHTGIVESLARHALPGMPPVPRAIVAQHEMVAISAAMGYTQITGRPQAVIVHVDVGTQNLGAGVHNASRSRVPILLFAGLAPLTLYGEKPGGKSHPVHYLQDVYDQRGIVREYVKWEYELRSAHNIADAVSRALQMATSAPSGPVYMAAAREVLEEAVTATLQWPQLVSTEPSLPSPESVDWLLEKIRGAERPLLITGYLGQDPDAVPALVRFAERFGVGVCETRTRATNFPTDHELHVGFAPAALIEEADLIITADSDVPWVPGKVRFRDDACIVRVDVDPLQSHMPFYPHRADRLLQCSSRLLFHALADTPLELGEAERIAARRRYYSDIHEKQRRDWRAKGNAGELNAATLSRLVAEVAGEAIVVDETITSGPALLQQLPRICPGRYISNGGSGLGYGLGAALGAKLARPEEDVVLLVGDGSYFFGQPTAVHWAQRAYEVPFLTIIYNNAGWQAVEDATLEVHPHGEAARSGNTGKRFLAPPEFSRVVAVADGYGRKVSTVAEAADAIEQGLAAVRAGRPAVIDARIE